MQTDIALRRVAIGCAVALLFGPLGGRTTWVEGHTTATDAAVYNAVALLAGAVAIAALAFALWARPRVVLPLLGALVAVAAFGLTAYVCGVDVWARMQGQVWVYAGWTIAGDTGRNTTVYPAWGPPVFALAALVGSAASLALAGCWLRRPEARSRAIPG